MVFGKQMGGASPEPAEPEPKQRVAGVEGRVDKNGASLALPEIIVSIPIVVPV